MNVNRICLVVLIAVLFSQGEFEDISKDGNVVSSNAASKRNNEKSNQQKSPKEVTPINPPAAGTPKKRPIDSSSKKPPAKVTPQRLPAKGTPKRRPAKGSPKKQPAKVTPQRLPAKATTKKPTAKVCTRHANRGVSPIIALLTKRDDLSRSTNDTTIDACENSCGADVAKCRSYEFITDLNGSKICILYRNDISSLSAFNTTLFLGVGGAFDLVSLKGTTVAICVSSTGCTRMENVKTHSVAPFKSAGKISTSISKCEKLCVGESGCNGYQYVSDLNFCTLFQSDVSPFRTSDSTVGKCFSCTRIVNKTTNSRAILWTIVFSDPIVDNIDECERRCNAAPACRGYRFVTGLKVCTLYRTDVSSSLTPDSTATVAICN